MARVVRWDRPIRGTRDRIAAWVNMLFVDHGVFRLINSNRHLVTDKVWRSAQPAPHQLARLARAGVRTIVNLRGQREHGSWQLQREACDRHGMDLVELTIRSRAAPSVGTIREAKKVFDGLRYPALIHCKSGADRAGFAATLYLILQEGASVADARKQLSLRYGHIRFGKTGILDAFFDQYQSEGEAVGMPLLEWVEQKYSPEKLERDFRPYALADLLLDKVLRRE
ncbi:protein tyrosine phosphatase [Microvirga vignae]|uniref:Protein tyrosine phosphatase n=2 Tax=Microvirga vignae TaxID=1225564 RepID=A0A0H1REU2_9HYPH|nr:sulfur transferase domain-containing protein [Microvirga vignae]KLK93718.1 protein tyrosine phosphatase [Microvirga vignae]